MTAKPRDYKMEADDKRDTYANIISKMRKSEVEKVKFLCRSIEDKEITDLIEFLSKKRIDEYDFFIECLILIGRLDLVNELGCNKHDMEEITSNLKEYKSSAGLNSSIMLLYTLADNMEESEVKRIVKYFCEHDKVYIPERKLKECYNALQLMSLLLKVRHIEPTNLQSLFQLVHQLKRTDLQEIIESYQGSLEKNKSKDDEDDDYYKEPNSEANGSKHRNVSPPVHHPKQPAISTDHETENASKHGNVSPPVDHLKQLAISTDHGTGSIEENKSKKDEDFKETVVEKQTLQKYKMDANPRGICLIFNNVNFKTLKKRTGSDVDRNELKKVFTSFHFEITVFDDFTTTGMKEKLEEFASKDHTRYDCFVCCILSHGAEGVVYGVDGEGLSYKTVISGFTSSKCNSLVGKPKLFFIQACQGENQMTGPKIESDGSSPSRVPDVADLLMAFATFQGYKAIRHPTTGTWFIQNLCKVLNDFGKTLDLTDMLLMVNDYVGKEEDTLDGEICKQVPAPVSTLRKKLFFLDTL